MLAVEDLAFGYGARTVGSGVSFRLGARTVGSGVSFRLGAGEALCLLGPNGSGKTTLFKTLLGLLPARGGRILLDGADLARMPRKAVARSLAYVPQAHAALFPYRVREVVLMGRASRLPPFASPSTADRAAAESALDALGIGHLAERIYTEISGGERQLALIARALAGEPRLLVMDEPTASLDFGNQARVLGEIRRLTARGIGVVLSTHDPGHAFLCADRVALLDKGTLAGLGSPSETVTPETLRQIYGVAVAVVPLPGHAATVCAPLLD